MYKSYSPAFIQYVRNLKYYADGKEAIVYKISQYKTGEK
ncbi:hypothetical protein bpmyx0001_27990 [Bacillus pseudomycoides DSM 12442]|nr:hypothetical protein bpmyx0001_27990 [Bacillus pseudomycoides DSM 12442]